MDHLENVFPKKLFGANIASAQPVVKAKLVVFY